MSDIYILSLDPSCVGVTGAGLFRFSSDGLLAAKPVCLASVQISVPNAPKGTFPKRLCAMAARMDRVAYTRDLLARFVGNLPLLPQLFAYEVPIGLREIEADINQAIGAFTSLSCIRSIPDIRAIHSSTVKKVQGTSSLATSRNGGKTTKAQKQELLKQAAVNWANVAISWQSPLSTGDDAIADAGAVAVAAFQQLALKGFPK